MQEIRDTEFSILSSSIEETHNLAAEFSMIVPWGSVIGLSGELGAGKTEFVRGFAQGLGVDGGVSSPTFVLEQIYPIQIVSKASSTRSKVDVSRKLSHWDLYRLARDVPANEIADQCGDTNIITLVEWAERADWLLNLLCCTVFLSPVDGPESQRQIAFLNVTDKGILTWLKTRFKGR